MQALTSRQKWSTLAAVSLAVFMTAVDNTVVNVALPSIKRDLGLGQSALEWIVNGYILAFAALLLTGGKLGDLLGRKRVFLSGLAVFTGASLFGGFADGETLLVAARVVQGVGAALMVPATLAIITAAFPAEERGRAVGIWAAVGALGFGLGPVTGGVLAQHVHWSWIFWINVPVGLVALLLGSRAIAESRDGAVGRTIDLPGVLLSGSGLFGLTYALVEANRFGWGSPAILGLFGVFFFLSLYLQGIVGLSAVQGGLAFLPLAAVLIVASPLSAKLAERFGAARVVASGMLVFGLGLYLISRVDAGSHYLDVLPGLLVAALGSALTTPLTTAIISSVPVDKAGIASGALNTSRELSGSLGIAVMGAILAARESSALADGATPAAAFVSGYSLALTISAVVMVAGAGVALATLRERRVRVGAPALESL
jgi:MFS family permease